LRNRHFFSLDELNVEVRECVATINAKVMKKFAKSRRELLETIDRPALNGLPCEPYQYAEWKRCGVAPDYHVEVDDHYYSVPFRHATWRGGDPAGQRHGRDHVWVDRIHPQDRATQSLPQSERAGRPADPARQHPGSWLLPLTQSDAGERTLRVNRKTKGETMLTHPTHDRMVALGLTGMAKALEEQRKQPDIATLGFEERLALMVDREAIERENKRLVSRLKFSSLRQSAVVEDVDMKAPRGLDKALFAKLVAGDWIARHQSLLICGPTGTGKSWLACALGHQACRDDRSVLYH